jgi:hypothetical protein
LREGLSAAGGDFAADYPARLQPVAQFRSPSQWGCKPPVTSLHSSYRAVVARPEETMKKLGAHVAALETLMVAGAAGVTAAIWLSIAGVALPHGEASIVSRAIASPAAAMRYVTLPTVYIVGHAEAPQLTPAATTTTAQNTATNPVTLHQ